MAGTNTPSSSTFTPQGEDANGLSDSFTLPSTPVLSAPTPQAGQQGAVAIDENDAKARNTQAGTPIESCKECQEVEVISVKGQFVSNGIYQWFVKFQLKEPAKADGYIIQEVEYIDQKIIWGGSYSGTENIAYPNKGVKFWEAWPVKKGQTAPTLAKSEMGIEFHDNYLSKFNGMESFNVAIRGRARFCPTSKTLEELNFTDTQRVPLSGNRPSTKDSSQIKCWLTGDKSEGRHDLQIEYKKGNSPKITTTPSSEWSYGTL